MARREEHSLRKHLRRLLGEIAPSSGNMTNAQVIAERVIEAAREGKQWAIEMLRDTVEGRPAQAVREPDADRATDEALAQVTVRYLNALAGAGQQPESEPAVSPDPAPADTTDGGADQGDTEPDDPAALAALRLLDLPRHRPGYSKAAGGQSEVEREASR
jgi:hypothetical protein